METTTDPKTKTMSRILIQIAVPVGFADHMRSLDGDAALEAYCDFVQEIYEEATERIKKAYQCEGTVDFLHADELPKRLRND